jgi:hypothetical protein
MYAVRKVAPTTFIKKAGDRHMENKPAHGSKGQIPHYDLFSQWRQTDRENSVLRQVFRAPGEQQPGTIDFQTRDFNCGKQPERDS